MTLASIRLLDMWQALGGEPLRGKRGKAFWRDGGNYNVALDPNKNAFFDHRDGIGGGVLDLVQVALGCDRAGALKWLEAEGFIEPRALTHEQRQEHARRREAASRAAHDIACWRDALVVELNAQKLAAVVAGDDGTLARVSSLCNTLENGLPENVVRAFIRYRTSDSAEVGRLIAAGEKREWEAQRITAEVVLLLPTAAAAEDLSHAA